MNLYFGPNYFWFVCFFFKLYYVSNNFLLRVKKKKLSSYRQKTFLFFLMLSISAAASTTVMLAFYGSSAFVLSDVNLYCSLRHRSIGFLQDSKTCDFQFLRCYVLKRIFSWFFSSYFFLLCHRMWFLFVVILFLFALVVHIGKKLKTK